MSRSGRQPPSNGILTSDEQSDVRVWFKHHDQTAIRIIEDALAWYQQEKRKPDTDGYRSRLEKIATLARQLDASLQGLEDDGGAAVLDRRLAPRTQISEHIDNRKPFPALASFRGDLDFVAHVAVLGAQRPKDPRTGKPFPRKGENAYRWQVLQQIAWNLEQQNLSIVSARDQRGTKLLQFVLGVLDRIDGKCPLKAHSNVTAYRKELREFVEKQRRLEVPCLLARVPGDVREHVLKKKHANPHLGADVERYLASCHGDYAARLRADVIRALKQRETQITLTVNTPIHRPQ